MATRPHGPHGPHVPLPEDVNVNVVVRVRPPVERERQLGYKKCLSVDPLGHSLTVFQPPTLGSTSIPPKPLSPPQPTQRTFTYDYVADEFVNQEEMYTSVGKPMAHACLQGYHCCLIAYGQTGAGKTYTMEGPTLNAHVNQLDEPMSSEVTEKCGLIPRILETIFLILAAEKDQSGVEVDFLVRCSSLQIYNEQVEDLLCPDSTNLTIHEDAKMGMYVEGLQEVEVQTPEATYEVLKWGSLNRHVGATAMNSESSRSHGVFILSVESQRQDLGVLNRRISRFYLVDLAGSERQKQTEAVGLRLKESGSINRSLSALGNVIKALLETSEGKIRHIPYRDSKLTYLLKDALGGNSKCTLIANISPSIINLEETLSTLKFAQRAKFIRNVAIVNEDTLGNSSVSSEEVKRLRLEIASLRARMGSTSAGDQAISWNDHSSNNQVRRLEYIILQSTKQALAGEKKTAQEMHSLTRKMDALKSLYLRLDRTLQGLNASTLQKQRRRDSSPTFSPTQTHKKMARLHDSNTSTWDGGKMGSNNGASYRELNDGPKKMLGETKHHLERSFNDGDEDRFEGRLEIHPQEENPTALKSQVLQLKTMNRSLKLEVENLGKEKKTMFSEFSDIKRERDQSKKRLASLEDQISKLQDTIQKLRQESDKETQSSDDERRALINFQKKRHIQAFKRFISRPRVTEVHHQQPSLLCRLLKRKKWSGSSSRLTS